ncbi:MAG: M48 family metallopeptidase [Verrucomicrobia bacterium]|nr:M48 family metallopeptidase [Verrucomicrobiota bacterium]
MDDFFERQERARKRTRWLIVYFVLAVFLIIVAIYITLAAIFLRERAAELSFGWLWNSDLFLGSAVGTLAVVVTGSLYKIVALRQGGSAVALSLDGRPLPSNTRDPAERKLLNVIEEMSIASGTPVPAIYVLPNEGGINAFAAGHSPRDAAIGVTRGSVELLSRDELQGVIAHEFSHILNGDMRLNLRLIGIVHGILCIALVGRILLRTQSSNRSGSRGKGGNPLPLVGLAFLVIGSIGVFFGRLIKSAVSRQREFLADASAVQFTRNPAGLAGALKKIGGLEHGSRLNASKAEEASHLFFGNGLAKSWFSLLSTHPPLEERIRLLDPAFDGKFPCLEETGVGAEFGTDPGIAGLDAASRRPFPATFVSGEKPPPLLPVQAAFPQMGAPTLQHLDYAANFRAMVPDALWESAHEPMQATALVYALLLSADAAVRAAQLARLQSDAEAAIHADTVRLAPLADSLDSCARLPLALLAVSALRHLSLPQYDWFAQSLQTLIASDEEIDLFEYTLQKIVLCHLEPNFHPPRRQGAQFYSLKPLAADGAVLLSALAWLGNEDPEKSRQAFDRGLDGFGDAGLSLPFLPGADCGLVQINDALNRFALAALPIKKLVLEACARAVAADGVIQVREAELLRAIADTLGCPIPPYIHGV